MTFAHFCSTSASGSGHIYPNHLHHLFHHTDKNINKMAPTKINTNITLKISNNAGAVKPMVKNSREETSNGVSKCKGINERAKNQQGPEY